MNSLEYLNSPKNFLIGQVDITLKLYTFFQTIYEKYNRYNLGNFWLKCIERVLTFIWYMKPWITSVSKGCNSNNCSKEANEKKDFYNGNKWKAVLYG